MANNFNTYNGIPVFEVSFTDFTMIVDARLNNKRLLSKNIMNESLQEYYKAERKPEFYIMFGGVKVKYPL